MKKIKAKDNQQKTINKKQSTKDNKQMTIYKKQYTNENGRYIDLTETEDRIYDIYRKSFTVVERI